MYDDHDDSQYVSVHAAQPTGGDGDNEVVLIAEVQDCVEKLDNVVSFLASID